MPTHRFYIGNMTGVESVGKIFHRGMAVLLVIVFQRFHQANGRGFQVTARKTTVGYKSLAHDQHILEIFGPGIIVANQKSSNIDQAVFLQAHRGAIGIREYLLCDLQQGFILVTGFPFLYEIGVFRKTTGIQDKRYSVFFKYRLGLADVLHGDRLTAAGVVGNGDHGKGDFLPAVLLNGLLQGGNVHIALEGCHIGIIQPFITDQIKRIYPNKFKIGAGGIEVAVIGYNIPFVRAGHGQNTFCGTALVRGKNMLHPGDSANGLFESTERRAARIAFVAQHHRGPLLGGHGPGAAIGQQVDSAIFRVEIKNIVMGCLQSCGTLFGRNDLERFGDFYTKGFNNGFHAGSFFSDSASIQSS